MPKRTPLIALGATVAAAGAAALSPLGADLRPAAADAQSSTTTRAQPATPPQREREPLGQREKEAEAALAKALGKSTAEVHAARRTVLEARLEEQRSAGRLTTEQGEAILRAFDVYVPVGPLAGGGPGGFGGPGGGGPGGGPRGERPEGERPSREQRQERREERQQRRGERRGDDEAALAKALGVSVADLRSARAEVLDAQLAEAQKAGRITAAQRKAAVEAARKGERPAGLGPRGHHGPGPGGPGGPGRFGPGAPGTPAGPDGEDG